MAIDKLQVLVIEDYEDDFLNVCQLLRKSVPRAEVERAATADTGLQIALEDRHDACLLDYRLGESDGLEVLRQLKRSEATVPVIFLTGQGDEEIAVEAMKAGATDYLLKSRLTAPLLEAALRYALTLRDKDDAVRVARHALQASEQRFRALVENSSDGILLLDAQGTINYASQSLRALLGYAPEEMIDTDAFRYVHSDDAGAVREAFRAMLHAPAVPVRM